MNLDVVCVKFSILCYSPLKTHLRKHFTIITFLLLLLALQVWQGADFLHDIMNEMCRRVQLCHFKSLLTIFNILRVPKTTNLVFKLKQCIIENLVSDMNSRSRLADTFHLHIVGFHTRRKKVMVILYSCMCNLLKRAMIDKQSQAFFLTASLYQFTVV